MTRNRARKQATRQRAALTGERYVVAQRNNTVAEPQPPKTGWMHELTHRVPGVPAHVDGGLQGTASGRVRSAGTEQRNAPRPHPARKHQRRQHGEPRVLVTWQNWIARRVGAN